MSGVYNGPTFFHQLGHQDQNRCLELLTDGVGSGVIFSPKHLTENGLTKKISLYKEINTTILVDPQFYNVRSALSDNEQPIISFDNTGDIAKPNIAKRFVESALEKQIELGVSYLLIPCPLLPFGDEWLDIIHSLVAFATEWVKTNNVNIPLMSTIVISDDIITLDNNRFKLLNSLVGLNQSLDGIYLLLETSSQLEDEKLIFSMLDLIFRLKQNNFKLMLGYSSFWAILTFPFGLDSFASSAWENRRMFKKTEWKNKGQTHGRKKLYYWSSELLDRIIFPDEADLLQDSGLWMIHNVDSPFAEIFDGKRPTLIHQNRAWKEGDSFKHYSWSLDKIAKQFSTLKVEERINTVRYYLHNTIDNYATMDRKGVSLRITGDKFKIWLQAFDKYIDEIGSELYYMYR